MRRIFEEYMLILGYSFSGLVFGLAFFLLFLNFYHYKELNTPISKPAYSETEYTKITEAVVNINKNISLFNVNNYKGSENKYELLAIQSKLNICAKQLSSEELKKALLQEQIYVSDIYNLIEVYQKDIVNGCLVKQLYDIAASNEEETTFKSDKIKVVAPFIKTTIDAYRFKTTYIQGTLRNNSNYYFSNQMSKSNVFDYVNDSYSEVAKSISDTAIFVEKVSQWYGLLAGGSI